MLCLMTQRALGIAGVLFRKHRLLPPAGAQGFIPGTRDDAFHQPESIINYCALPDLIFAGTSVLWTRALSLTRTRLSGESS